MYFLSNAEDLTCVGIYKLILLEYTDYLGMENCVGPVQTASYLEFGSICSPNINLYLGYGKCPKISNPLFHTILA